MIVSKIRMSLLTLSLLFTTSTIFAQQPLTVDAGSDQIICSTQWGVDTTTIGGQPSAIGGVPPYTYTWSFTYLLTWTQAGHTIYGSDFLNDTSLANPDILGIPEENNTNLPYLKLIVTDAAGNTASDSIRLIFSAFAFTLGGSMSYYIHQGDSIYCSGADIFGGVGTSSYLWRPNHGLIDSTNNTFWTKPDTTIHYTLTLTDSVGCSQSGQEGAVIVTVFPVGIEDGQPNTNIKIYPNPASDFIQIEIANSSALKGDQFILYDMLGSEMVRASIQSKQHQIDVSHLAKGNYTYRIGSLSGKIVLK